MSFCERRADPPRVFSRGTETDRVEVARDNRVAEIVYPPDQALLALDPDKNARAKVFSRERTAGRTG